LILNLVQCLWSNDFIFVSASQQGVVAKGGKAMEGHGRRWKALPQFLPFV